MYLFKYSPEVKPSGLASYFLARRNVYESMAAQIKEVA
jgi:hypothetical protein